MRERYVVTVNRDPRLNISDMEAYIREAVYCWSGSYAPDDVRRNHGKVAVRKIRQ